MSVPALVVGVGGTGTRIVAQLERLVGDPAGRGLALLAVDARFQPELPLRHAVFHPVPGAVNLAEMARRYEAEIASWWPRPLVPSSHVAYTDGCGMVRAYGRFFAVWHASLVGRGVADALGRLGENLESDQALDTLLVFIAGSLTNGTGAGSMHDLALLLRQHARRDHRFERVVVVGVHLDATAISGASGALVPDQADRRRTANALAALLELQHAYDTARAGGVPYTTRLRGADGTWVDLAAAPGESPFDYTMLFQGKNRRGRQVTREEAIEQAAHSLALWVGAGDVSDRMLDTFVSVEDRGRFGSLGAGRLRVPDEAIADWVELELLHRTLNWMVDAAPEGAGALLRQADDTLQDLDPTVASAVDHLVEHVLEVKEIPGFEKNQLFDRFREHDDEMRAELDRLLQSVVDESEAVQVPGLARECVAFVQRAEGLARDRVTLADEWLKTLYEPRLERWLEALVARGALGLALTALDALREAFVANLADVEAHEARPVREKSPPSEDDYAENLAEVERLGNSPLARLPGLARFPRGRMEGHIGTLDNELHDDLEWYLRNASVQAVERVYHGLIHWCDAKLEVLRHARAHVLGEATRDEVVELRERAARAMRAGVEGELTVGGPDYARRTLDRLLDDESRRPRALAGTGGEVLLDMVAELAEARRQPRRWAAETRGERSRERQQAVRDALRRAISGAVRQDALSRCQVDAVLRDVTEHDVDLWAAHALDSRDPGDHDRAREHVTSRYGATAAEELENLDWVGDRRGAREAAAERLAAARVRRAFHEAAANWQTDVDTDLRVQHFVVVHPDNRWIRKVLDELAARDPSIHVSARRVVPRTELGVLTVELGADIDELDISPFHDEAYAAFFEHRDFNPHVDRRYGHAWAIPGRWNRRRSERAALLVLLAEELGLLVHRGSGAWVAAENLAHPKGGRPLVEGATLTEKRGLEHLVRALESDRNRDLAEVLRHHVRERLAFGTGRFARPEDRAAFLDRLGFAIEKRRQAQPEHAGIFDQARLALADLVEALREDTRLPDWL